MVGDQIPNGDSDLGVLPVIVRYAQNLYGTNIVY